MLDDFVAEFSPEKELVDVSLDENDKAYSVYRLFLLLNPDESNRESYELWW